MLKFSQLRAGTYATDDIVLVFEHVRSPVLDSANCICSVNESTLRLNMLTLMIPYKVLQKDCCWVKLEGIYVADRENLETAWVILNRKRKAHASNRA